MFSKKPIQLFETTNLALESIRTILEVQLEKQVQFRQIDIHMSREINRGGRHKPPTYRNYTVHASFTVKDNQHGKDEVTKIYAKVGLTNLNRAEKPIWLLDRAYLKIDEDWFWAHPEGYKAVGEGINFPPRVRVARENQTPKPMWSIGSGCDDVSFEPVS